MISTAIIDAVQKLNVELCRESNPDLPVIETGSRDTTLTELSLLILFIHLYIEKRKNPDVQKSKRPYISSYHIAHLRQQYHNSKFVIFQERLLKVLKYYNFL